MDGHPVTDMDDQIQGNADPVIDEPIPEAAPSKPSPSTDPRIKLLMQAAPGLIMAAGVLHLALVETHMAHARGAGLFFLAIGAAQIVWAFLYMRQPSANMRVAGLMGLALAPTILYVLTRIWRAPWAAAPEPVDVFGVATQLLQVAALAGLLLEWILEVSPGPKFTFTNEQARVVAAGLLIGIAGYAGALVAEDVEWLATAEAAHGHDDGHDDGHGSHAVDGFGTRGESLIGTIPYYGPADARGILNQCQQVGEPNQGCWTSYLKDRLVAFGSVDAFDTLVDLMAQNTEANRDSHAIAHDLGRFAYQAYGYDITLTLGECSYEVFQGCLHGALQIFFDDVAGQGGKVDKETIRSTCAAATSDFEIYACLHGVGHGVMLYTNYKLHQSLDMCSWLDTWFAQHSCYGGVFMENVVGYTDSLNPTAAGGHQGHGGHSEPPTFWVDPQEPTYPCNVVADAYKDPCWRMQTSLILKFNNGDFVATAKVCEESGPYRLACYNSLGRDAAPWANRDPWRMSQHCSYGAEDAQASCVEGFSAGEVLQENNPDAGLTLCSKLPEKHKEPCYRAVATQAARMYTTEEVTAFCNKVPQNHREACTTAAGI